MGLKMEEGGDVMAHLNDFNRCITNFIRVNVKYEDDDKALLLLRSLPDSFKHFRTTLLFGNDTLECDVKEEVNKNNGEKRVVTEIPITTKFSDIGSEDVQLEEIQQEEVLKEPSSMAQGRLRRISKSSQRYG
ncbi:hypothetical protein JRO89_XSUnG0138700 [Xanthoceras sorbifolium]|uniref:Retrovirus-related Pol polyprotein from transposon TNT 1-94 n=1 Tax=Xanthoceras sorbifolium TaxID=99658 RepID=A0ABQ8GY43_9ROSI|nr:hypothetical protein JRO89_XSUnG0138700 [Xanthoceras sorbifolium]